MKSRNVQSIVTLICQDHGLILDEDRKAQEIGRPRRIKCAVFFTGWPPLSPEEMRRGRPISWAFLSSSRIRLAAIVAPSLYPTMPSISGFLSPLSPEEDVVLADESDYTLDIPTLHVVGADGNLDIYHPCSNDILTVYFWRRPLPIPEIHSQYII
jgi:hypothetical protein